MEKRQQSSSAGTQRGNSMPPTGKTPNRADAGDMRQARQQEQQELKEEASLPEDPDPALDEQDLEENKLSVEEADNIQWDQPSEKNKKSGL
jgi:hypothetical protein